MAGETVMKGLVERDAELGRIGAALVRSGAGSGSVVLVEGAAGIGKTELLRAAGETARERRHTVLAASGGELERDFAFAVVRQWFERTVAGEGAGLLVGAAALARPALALDDAGPVAPPPGDPGFFRVTHGLYWLAANLCERGPLMLVLDDAHWADPPSLRFAAYLARRCAELPVVLLVAVRPGEPGSDAVPLGDLAGGPAVSTLRPRPLSAATVAAMAGDRLGEAPDDAFVAACHAATGGNPFLLRELLDALALDEVRPVAEQAALVQDIGPHTVSRSILGRVGRLPAPAAGVAIAASVLGQEAGARAVCELAGAGEAAAGAALDALAAIGLIEARLPVRFTHPILRAAVYHDVPPVERSRLHAAAAELLARDGVPADRVAPHLLATMPAARRDTVEALREAGRLALQRGAPDVAARCLRRALAEPPPQDLVGAVEGDLGWAALLCGEQPAEAVEHLERSLGHPAPPLELAVRALRFARGGHSVSGSPRPVAVLERLIDELGDTDPEVTLLLEVELSALGLLDEQTVPRVASRLERFAGVAGGTLGERLALSSLAMRRAVSGAPASEAVALARHGVGLPLEVAAWATSFYEAMGALVMGDETGTAIDELTRFVDDARRRGSPFVVCGVATLRALAHLRAGDLHAAEADARDALAATAFNRSFVPLAYAVLVEVLVERDTLDEAQALLDEATPPERLPNVVHFNNIFLPRSRLRRARGDFDGAAAELAELEAREERLGLRNPFGRWRAEAAELALLRGDRDEARRLAGEAMRIADGWGTAGARGMALRTRGLVEGGTSGIALLREAVAAFDASPQRLEAARTLVELGAALRRAGQRSQARTTLTDAVDAARRCGAPALARRAHDELVAAGARPRRLQFSGADALTASERRVCEMAAGGMSNREIAQVLFVTAKTVENHLGRAYVKLGIDSRAKLPAALAAAE